MRTDSQNLLERLDQPDFDYHEFSDAAEGARGYAWPLLEQVARTLGLRRRRDPAPVGVAAPQPDGVPSAGQADRAPVIGADSHPFFARYRRAPAGAPPPAAAPPMQDLGSLLQSYSDTP